MVPKINEVKFSKLIEKNKEKFYAIAKSILNNNDDVYDALQEALLSMYQNINKLKNSKYFSTWGTRIVMNKCYDIIRKNKKSSENVPLEEYAEDLNISTQDKYNLDEYGIQKVLNSLEYDVREIAILYYYNDVSVKNIAFGLGVPEGTVKTKLAKARNKLKEKLEKEGL